MHFYGCTPSELDQGGRIKLPPWVQGAFSEIGKSEVMLYCLPEGCLAVFPLSQWQEYRQHPSQLNELQDLAYRRHERLVGAMSFPGDVTSQGRLQLPEHLMEAASLKKESTVILVGAEKWFEVWSLEHWEHERGQLVTSD